MLILSEVKLFMCVCVLLVFKDYLFVDRGEIDSREREREIVFFARERLLIVGKLIQIRERDCFFARERFFLPQREIVDRW